MALGDIFNFFFNSKETKLKNGVHQLNYKNGNVMLLGKVTKGKKVGVWKTYFENGKLKSRGSFDKGDKTGYWEYFHENNQIKQKDIYS